jgi:hypothetical protein
MLIKLHVGYGLNEARHFKKGLYFAVYDTVAVTNSLNYTVQTSNPLVNLI